jgi:hypothetical protein
VIWLLVMGIQILILREKLMKLLVFRYYRAKVLEMELLKSKN